MSFWSDNRFSAAINKQLVCLGLAGGAESRRMLWLTAAYALIYILVASCCRPAECIRMTRVHAESDSSRVEALLGSNITLRCPFELEGNDQLYSIKWHKKLNGTFFEFYSYSKSTAGASVATISAARSIKSRRRPLLGLFSVPVMQTD